MKTPIEILLVGLALCSSLFGQDHGTVPEAPPDPYTRGERDLLEAAGYVKFGPFPWADSHSSRDIEATLGEEVLWVETRHFRIGSTLGPYEVDRNDRVEVKKLKEELARLREVLPRVPKKARILDPWLRLHLYAMRAEDLYAQMQEVLQVSDRDFPQSPEHASAFPLKGVGPYLGMKNKFTILLTERQSTLARYGAAYCNRREPGPILHHFHQNGVQFLGFSAEFDGMAVDTTMHCMITYCLTLNLLDGYLSFRHSVPAWVSAGLGHHHARAIDQKRNYFTSQRTFSTDDKDVWDWEVRVRGRVKNAADPGFEEMTAWADHGSLSFPEIMVAWARVDFLLREHPQELAEFIRVIKSPFPTGTVVDAALMQKHQIQAFQAVLDLGPGEFDAIWRSWIPKNYRKK